MFCTPCKYGFLCANPLLYVQAVVCFCAKRHSSYNPNYLYEPRVAVREGQMW